MDIVEVGSIVKQPIIWKMYNFGAIYFGQGTQV